MKTKYQKLMKHIPVPAGLNEQVLLAARRETAPARPGVWSGLRRAACAACALALVLGTLTLRPVKDQHLPDGEEPSGAMISGLTFALTAYAAETGEARAPAADGSLTFTAGEGTTDPESGAYTGCLFQVTGTDVRSVTLSIDRGGLYRYQMHSGLTDEEIAQYRQAMAEGTMATAAISQDDAGRWYMPEMTALGASVTEDYDPDRYYGFWVPTEELSFDGGKDLGEQAADHIDIFEGAVLTVTAVFGDGSSQTQNYRLHTGNLRVAWNADGTQTILPELAGENDPCTYGVYILPEA